MSGKSGMHAGKDSLNAFERFIVARNEDGGWQDYILPGRRGLNKTAISRAKECCFARSVFVQNPAIKSRFARLVDELTQKGILKSDIGDIPLLDSTGSTRDEAVAELQGTIAKLGNDIADLMRFLKETNDKVAWYEAEARIIIKGHPAKGGR